MRKLLFILILFPSIVFSQNYTQQIDSIIYSKFNNGPAVSALITQNSEAVYSKIKGYSDIENTVLATDSSKFRIGSVTKQFTAISILMLQEEGKLSTKDPIQNYLPSFPVKSKPILIEHLLTHTSGLKEVTETEVFFEQLMKNGCKPDTLVNFFKDYPLEFNPGTEFKYCNSGYHLLGMIIEKVSKMSYGDFIQKNIFSPAKMVNSQIDDNSTLISNRVSGYESKHNEIQNATYIDMSIPYSAGNIISTTADLNKWYENLFEYKFVSKITLEKAHSKYQLTDSTYINYGYGWFIDTLQGEKVISHEGGINGFLSSVWYVPSHKTLSVLLSNCMCNPTTQTTKTILAYAIGKPIEKRKPINVPATILNKYIGTYLMGGEKWSILIKDNELYCLYEGGNGHALLAKSNKEFYAEEWDAQFIFNEGNGEMDLTFKYTGGQARGKKITVYNKD